MDVDLKNLDGDPGDVAQAAVVAALAAHNNYMAALSEAEKYVRNAFFDEAERIGKTDYAEAWRESWEARILAFLRTKAESHSGVLSALQETVGKYEGYGG